MRIPKLLIGATRYVLLLLIFFSYREGCAADQRDEAAYADWKRQNKVSDEQFANYLRNQKLADVVPMYQLLRSATDWEKCNAAPFAVPPESHWKHVTTLLRLVQQLRTSSAIGTFDVHSGYRSSKLNACARGARRSAHTKTFAIDITPDAITATSICQFWKTHGKNWKMGLSRYASGRLHLDTQGYRTWGSTHRYESSYCK
jgi:Peptidase M15